MASIQIPCGYIWLVFLVGWFVLGIVVITKKNPLFKNEMLEMYFAGGYAVCLIVSAFVLGMTDTWLYPVPILFL